MKISPSATLPINSPSPAEPRGKSRNHFTSTPVNVIVFLLRRPEDNGLAIRSESADRIADQYHFRGRPLQTKYSSSDSNRDCLGAISCPQLIHDAPQMHFHRIFGNPQVLADVTIAIPSRDLLKNFDFTRCKAIFTHIFGKLCRDFGWQPFFSGMNLTDHPDQFSGRRAF